MGRRVQVMKLIIKYNGRKIGFFFEGANGTEPAVLGLPEYTVRKIRAAGGPRLNVMAAKVCAALKGHVWPRPTEVVVEQANVRLVACPA